MNILLVLPNEVELSGHYMANLGTSIPLGLGYLAAVLERAGHSAEIVDFQIKGVTLEKLAERLAGKHYDMCGISVTTPFSPSAYTIADAIKRAAPDTPLVLGGPHTIAIGETVLKECPAADYAVFGEGEITILELLEAIEGGRSPESVKGIGFRKGPDIVQTAPREFIRDINSIPLPAYHLFSFHKYRPLIGWYRRLPWANIITSRGCPYSCIYCNKKVWGFTCRLRTAENVLDEILLLKKEYGVREISFGDDTFTLNRKRTLELCEMLTAAGKPVIWKCGTRVDLVDPDLLREMKKSGCYSIGFGVESGSDKILEIINKGVTKDQVRKAFKDVKEAGIETRAYFMLNIPHDTPETTEESIRFSRELDPDYLDFEIAHPYPGTAFRDLIEGDSRYTIIREKWDDPRAQIGNHILYLQPGLPADALKMYLRKAFRGYYLRPRQILRQLRLVMRPGSVVPGIRAAWNVLRLRVAD